MAEPLNEALARYGPTAAGVIIGTAAKYGLTLTEGRRVTWRGLIADLLLLSMLGLIALTSGDLATLFGVKLSMDAKILSGALAAVSSDRLVRLVRERYLKKMADGGDLAGVLKQADALAEVPPHPQPATMAKLTVFRSADPRAAAVERLAEGDLPVNRHEFDALIDQLDQPK